MSWNKLQKTIEAINTYYAFGVLVYVFLLYVARHSGLFLWIILVATPLFTAWTGYLLHGYLQQRNQRYGFKVLADVMSYVMTEDRTAYLRYSTTLQADADHLIVYPVGYQWTGSGKESLPVITGAGQQLIGVIEEPKNKKDCNDISPYEELVPSEGKWEYWLVGLTPPAYRGDIVEIKYLQEFNDKNRTAKPYLYYFVRTPMKRLELNVKFPPNALPKTVTCSYIKPSDPRRAHTGRGVVYEPDKQWASWVIERPKKGYCYRIQWQ